MIIKLQALFLVAQFLIACFLIYGPKRACKSLIITKKIITRNLIILAFALLSGFINIIMNLVEPSGINLYFELLTICLIVLQCALLAILFLGYPSKTMIIFIRSTYLKRLNQEHVAEDTWSWTTKKSVVILTGTLIALVSIGWAYYIYQKTLFEISVMAYWDGPKGA